MDKKKKMILLTLNLVFSYLIISSYMDYRYLNKTYDTKVILITHWEGKEEIIKKQLKMMGATSTYTYTYVPLMSAKFENASKMEMVLIKKSLRLNPTVKSVGFDSKVELIEF